MQKYLTEWGYTKYVRNTHEFPTSPNRAEHKVNNKTKEEQSDIVATIVVCTKSHIVNPDNKLNPFENKIKGVSSHFCYISLNKPYIC